MFMPSVTVTYKCLPNFLLSKGKSIAPSIAFRKKTQGEWTEFSVGGFTQFTANFIDHSSIPIKLIRQQY
jgi:hypothetical protein